MYTFKYIDWHSILRGRFSKACKECTNSETDKCASPFLFAFWSPQLLSWN